MRSIRSEYDLQHWLHGQLERAGLRVHGEVWMCSWDGSTKGVRADLVVYDDNGTDWLAIEVKVREQVPGIETRALAAQMGRYHKFCLCACVSICGAKKARNLARFVHRVGRDRFLSLLRTPRAGRLIANAANGHTTYG